VVNADESEPGTCKDVPLMMASPHTLVEGVIISSYAIRATHAFIYVRGEVLHVVRRLQRAVQEAYLAGHLGHERVRYPGLESHPQHSLACMQMRGMGGMVTVDVGTKELANRVLKKVRIFSLAESLGGVESLISHPASMTHASVPPERRAALGITEGMVRLSCGVEDTNDLLQDVEQAFAGL